MKSSATNRVLVPIASYIQARPVVSSLLVVLVAAGVASLVFPETADSRVPGSGNGLAVVAKVAQAHRGSAGYRRSEILGGACFFLSIPLELSRAEIASMGAVTAPLVIAV